MNSQDAVPCSWLTWALPAAYVERDMVNCFRNRSMALFIVGSQNWRAKWGNVRCGCVFLSLFLQVWPAGYGLWAVWSEVGEAGVKDAAHLEDERLHVEPTTFRQGGTKQVFCSGNLWRSVRRKGLLLLLYVFLYPSIFCCLFTFKLESIGFEAKEKLSFFPSVLLWL